MLRKILIPMKSLQRVVDYLYEDEKAHAEEQKFNEGNTQEHIFNDIRRLKKSLNR